MPQYVTELPGVSFRAHLGWGQSILRSRVGWVIQPPPRPHGLDRSPIIPKDSHLGGRLGAVALAPLEPQPHSLDACWDDLRGVAGITAPSSGGGVTEWGDVVPVATSVTAAQTAS